MRKFQVAIEAWQNALGQQNVVDKPTELKANQTTTFYTTQKVVAVLIPQNCDEVQQCLEIASKYKVPVYPISRGRNWGLGSSLPVENNCVLIDLKCMNRIIEFNEELGFIRVEPGVTFAQVAKFLQEKKSNYYLSTIGGPPDASLIGNLVERGDGVGSYGEKLKHCCNFEVVLPTGELLKTGLGRFENSASANLHSWGVGPSFETMFTQSNFGLVTKVTFWLTAKPAHFEMFLFTMQSDKELHSVCQPLKRLMESGVIAPNSIAIWNKYKFAASQVQYPWNKTGGSTPLPKKELDKISGPFKKMKWIGMIGIYSPTKTHAKASRKLIKSYLKPFSKFCFTLTKTKAQFLNLLSTLLSKLSGKNIQIIIDSLYNNSVFLGHPTTESIKGMYWRKKTAIPAKPNLERDKCGVIWLCPAVPFTGDDIVNSLIIIDETMSEHSFESVLAITFPSPRCAYVLPTIIYDRETVGEDKNAMNCHDSMISKLNDAGYLPHRLGIQSMDSLPKTDEGYSKLWQKIKTSVDPFEIMSPGRYSVKENNFLLPLSTSSEKSIKQIEV